MKKKIAFFLTLALMLALMAGCVGTPVVYMDCTCPTEGQNAPNQNPMDPIPVPEGAVKTGLAIVTTTKAAGNGTGVEYDVTFVAVNVDDAGTIVACKIDSLGTAVSFDDKGQINSDLNAAPQTKNELADGYNMVKFGGAIAEWYQQADALAQTAVGKTVEQLKTGYIAESGYAADGTDLAASATIYLGGYVAAIEAAVNNARHLGAQGGDELKLAVTAKLGDSTSATADKAGNAQLDCDATALTVKDGVITSCAIDSVQAKVAFDTTGTVTSDLNAPVKTKNQLGSDYNMVKYGGAIAEWDQQAAALAKYVTGKTGAQVAGIAVSEGKPSDVDLAASVTIRIGGFQALIAKALQ